jgi:predicted homoserine dehydrogenase-like protein
MTPAVTPERVAVAGHGAIGRRLIREPTDGIPGLALAAVATRRPDEVKRVIAAEGRMSSWRDRMSG